MRKKMKMIGKIFAAIGVMSVTAVTVSALAGDRISKALESVREKEKELNDEENWHNYTATGCYFCPVYKACPSIDADRAALCRVVSNADEYELSEIEELIRIARADLNESVTSDVEEIDKRRAAESATAACPAEKNRPD